MKILSESGDNNLKIWGKAILSNLLESSTQNEI
jgi:hypothetical protein